MVNISPWWGRVKPDVSDFGVVEAIRRRL